MNQVLGKDIILYLVNASSAVVPIGCARDVLRHAGREMIETSDDTSGRFKKFIAGMLNEGLSVTGITAFSNGSQYDSSDIYDMLKAAGTNLINFEYKVDNGTYLLTYSGQCLVASFEETSPWDGVSTYNCELQISGEVTVTQTGTYIPYYWLVSDVELTAIQVVALIEAGSSTSVSAPSYSTITINWGAPGGKWLYFAIPSTSPDRLSYYVSLGDQGRIGQPGDLFNYETKSITVGALTANYKVYLSNVSKVNNSPMDLRTFYPTSGGIMGYGTTVNNTATAPSSGTTFTIPALAGIQLNKLIILTRGTQIFTKIIASPAVPVGSEVSYDSTTGTLTVPVGQEWIGEEVTYIYLT